MRWVSVTECLSVIGRFQGIPPKLLQQAAGQGTKVHKYCLARAKGLYLPAPDDVAPYVEAFERWMATAAEDVLCVEEPLRDSGLMLTGTVDLVARIKGEKLYSIIDLKRTATVDWITGLQLAAYGHLAWKKFDRKFGPRYALQMQAGVECRAIPFTDPKDWDAFMCAYSLYNHSRKGGKR